MKLMKTYHWEVTVRELWQPGSSRLELDPLSISINAAKNPKINNNLI